MTDTCVGLADWIKISGRNAILHLQLDTPT